MLQVILVLFRDCNQLLRHSAFQIIVKAIVIENGIHYQGGELLFLFLVSDVIVEHQEPCKEAEK